MKYKISVVINIVLMFLIIVSVVPVPNETSVIGEKSSYDIEHSYSLFNEKNRDSTNSFLVEYDENYKPISSTLLGDVYTEIFMYDAGLYLTSDAGESICLENNDTSNLSEVDCTKEIENVSGESSIIGGANAMILKQLKSTEEIYNITEASTTISQIYPYSLDDDTLVYESKNYGPVSFDSFYLHS